MLDLDNITYPDKQKKPLKEMQSPQKSSYHLEDEYPEESTLSKLLRNVLVTGGKGVKKALDVPKDIYDITSSAAGGIENVVAPVGKKIDETLEGIPYAGSLFKLLREQQESQAEKGGKAADWMAENISGTGLEKVTRPLREKILPEDYEVPHTKREETWQDIVSTGIGDIPLYFTGSAALKKGTAATKAATKAITPLFNAAKRSFGFQLAKKGADDLGMPPIVSNIAGIFGSMGMDGFKSLINKGMMLGNKSLNKLESVMYKKAINVKPETFTLDLPKNTEAVFDKAYDKLPFLHANNKTLANRIKEEIEGSIVKLKGNKINLDNLNDVRKVLNRTIYEHKGRGFGALEEGYNQMIEPIRYTLDKFAKTNPKFGEYYNTAKHLTEITNTQSYLTDLLNKSSKFKNLMSSTSNKVLKNIIGSGEATLGGVAGYKMAGTKGAVAGALAGQGLAESQIIIRKILESPLVRKRAVNVINEAAKQGTQGLASAMRKFDKEVNDLEESTLVL